MRSRAAQLARTTGVLECRAPLHLGYRWATRAYEAVLGYRAGSTRQMAAAAAFALGADSVVDLLSRTGPLLENRAGPTGMAAELASWKTTLAATVSRRAAYLGTAVAEWQKQANRHPDLSADVSLDLAEGQGTAVLSGTQVALLGAGLDGLGLRGRHQLVVEDAGGPGRDRRLRVGRHLLVLPADPATRALAFDPGPALLAISAARPPWLIPRRPGPGPVPDHRRPAPGADPGPPVLARPHRAPALGDPGRRGRPGRLVLGPVPRSGKGPGRPGRQPVGDRDRPRRGRRGPGPAGAVGHAGRGAGCPGEGPYRGSLCRGRVVIVDDDDISRRGLAELLGDRPEIDVVAALTHDQARAWQAEWDGVDVLVVDAADDRCQLDHFLRVAVVESVRRRRRSDQTAVIVVTGHFFNDAVRRRMRGKCRRAPARAGPVGPLPAPDRALPALGHQDRPVTPRTSMPATASGSSPTSTPCPPPSGPRSCPSPASTPKTPA